MFSSLGIAWPRYLVDALVLAVALLDLVASLLKASPRPLKNLARGQLASLPLLRIQRRGLRCESLVGRCEKQAKDTN